MAEQQIAGWGNYPTVEAEVRGFSDEAELRQTIEDSGFITRGLARSYGDSALSEHVTLTTPYLTLRVAVSDALDEGVPVWHFRRADNETRDTWKTVCGELIDG